MRTKVFLGASLLYIFVMWLLVHSFFNTLHEVKVFGVTFNLKVATWVVAPLVLYFLFTIAHFLFCEWQIFKASRALKNDIHAFDEVAKATLLAQVANEEFKTQIFSTPTLLATALSPWSEEKVTFSNSKLNEIYSLFLQAKSGNAVNLKPFKLPPQNKLVILNELNLAKSDYAYALGILSSGRELNSAVKQQALALIAQKGDFEDVAKFEFDAATTREIIARLAKAEDLTPEQLRRLVKRSDFDAADFVQIALAVRNLYAPQEVLALFAEFKESSVSANEAYGFLLYDFGQIDELRGFLSHSDFKKLNTLLFLKESGKFCSSELFYHA